MNIANEIGIASLLEQCAEECAELSQACLKMSRKMRRENPTPMKKEDIWKLMNEEAADVQLCIDQLIKAGLLSVEEINSNRRIKNDRWEKRITESKEKEK